MTSENPTAYPLPRMEVITGPERRDAGPDGESWPHRAYTVRITYAGRSMDAPWMQGMGVTTEPDVTDIIGSLLMDASYAENCTGWADLAQEIGDDPDDMDDAQQDRARQVWRQITTLADALSDLLTRPLMIALMDDENSTYGAPARFHMAWDAAVGALSMAGRDGLEVTR